jgi:hypothetical protein
MRRAGPAAHAGGFDRVRPFALGVLLLGLAGCQAAPDLVGAATGVATTALTANPAVGVAVGLGTRAALDEGQKAFYRRWTRTEQEAIATAAGPLAVGERASWREAHSVPIGNDRGQLEVTRVMATPLTTCKEVVFSVGEDPEAPGRRLYTTVICQDGQTWRWATAEPAIARWGNLQ